VVSGRNLCPNWLDIFCILTHFLHYECSKMRLCGQASKPNPAGKLTALLTPLSRPMTSHLGSSSLRLRPFLKPCVGVWFLLVGVRVEDPAAKSQWNQLETAVRVEYLYIRVRRRLQRQEWCGRMRRARTLDRRCQTRWWRKGQWTTERSRSWCVHAGWVSRREHCSERHRRKPNRCTSSSCRTRSSMPGTCSVNECQTTA